MTPASTLPERLRLPGGNPQGEGDAVAGGAGLAAGPRQSGAGAGAGAGECIVADRASVGGAWLALVVAPSIAGQRAIPAHGGGGCC